MSSSSPILGVIGFPLGHSVSPAMHTAALEQLGLPYRYVPFEVPPQNLKDFIGRMRSENFLGLNVTIPHKEAVIPLLDGLDGIARKIGAVNAIVKRDGKLIGSNTDAAGFLDALREDGGVDPRGKNVLVLGVGGAARAVGFALVGAGAKGILFAGRQADKAQALVRDLQKENGVMLEAVSYNEATIAGVLPYVDIVVNATPLGMAPKAGDCPLADEAPLSTRHVVFDLVYNPLETRLIRMAKEAGSSTIVGIHMLVRQGALAFKMFTGKEPSLDTMRRAAIEALRKK